jgi:hypothetical protein
VPAHSKFLSAAAIAAALAALTACSSSSTSTASSTGSAPAASPSSSAAQSMTAAASPSGSTGASLSKCVAADMSGGISFKATTGGTADATVQVRNTSASPCTIQGYPGYGFLNPAAQLMPDSKTVRATGGPVTAFTVQPGGSGYASVQWKLCGSGGAQGNGGELVDAAVLTLPDDTVQITLKDENSSKDTGQYVWRVCSPTFTQAEPLQATS